MIFTNGRYRPRRKQAAAAWRPYIETCIEAFGPERGMFESNFPPDKGQCSYQVIFNAFKRIAAQYSEAEKTALFSKDGNRFLPAKTRVADSVASSHAHSPLRKTGTRRPSACTPSMLV